MENPPGKKPSRSRVSVVAAADDRISDLPDSVVCHILSFLPTRDVVATSILSTRWKFLWTEVTTLDFILCRDDDDEEEAAKVRKFVQFVNKVLIHIFSQRLQKFRLQSWQGYQLEPEYVSIWISYAISRSVRVLVIDLGHCNSAGIRLPGTLFCCATLEHLKIHANFMLKVPSAVSLPKLEVLDISHLTCESKRCVPKLVSGCPVLHLLKIGLSQQGSILDCMVSSPSLRHIEISAYDGKWTLKFERDATTTTPTPLSICFETITRLDMTVECCTRRRVVSALGKPTKLRVINITKVGSRCCKEIHESNWNYPTKVSKSLSSSLREVSFVGFSGLEDEIEMIKYILLHGKVLESFILKSAAADPGDNKIKYQLLQNLVSFPRSSRSCQIHFD